MSVFLLSVRHIRMAIQWRPARRYVTETAEASNGERAIFLAGGGTRTWPATGYLPRLPLWQATRGASMLHALMDGRALTSNRIDQGCWHQSTDGERSFEPDDRRRSIKCRKARATSLLSTRCSFGCSDARKHHASGVRTRAKQQKGRSRTERSRTPQG